MQLVTTQAMQPTFRQAIQPHIWAMQPLNTQATQPTSQLAMQPLSTPVQIGIVACHTPVQGHPESQAGTLQSRYSIDPGKDIDMQITPQLCQRRMPSPLRFLGSDGILEKENKPGEKTNDNYTSVWRKWERWCADRGVCPLLSDISDILSFLTQEYSGGKQYRSLNCYRSAISSTHLSVDGFPVGQHQLVS